MSETRRATFPFGEPERKKPKSGSKKEQRNHSSRYKHTVLSWLQAKFLLKSTGSISKQSVYEDYLHMCRANNLESTSAAVFGKLLHKAFPSVKTTRKGPRGAAKHHYKFLGVKDELTAEALSKLFGQEDTGKDHLKSSDGVLLLEDSQRHYDPEQDPIKKEKQQSSQPMFFHFEDWVKPKAATAQVSTPLPTASSTPTSPTTQKRQRSPTSEQRQEEEQKQRTKQVEESKRRGGLFSGIIMNRAQRGRGRARSEPHGVSRRHEIVKQKKADKRGAPVSKNLENVYSDASTTSAPTDGEARSTEQPMNSITDAATHVIEEAVDGETDPRIEGGETNQRPSQPISMPYFNTPPRFESGAAPVAGRRSLSLDELRTYPPDRFLDGLSDEEDLNEDFESDEQDMYSSDAFTGLSSAAVPPWISRDDDNLSFGAEQPDDYGVFAMDQPDGINHSDLNLPDLDEAQRMSLTMTSMPLPIATSNPSALQAPPLELLDMLWQQDELFRSQGPFEALEIRSDDEDERSRLQGGGGGDADGKDPFAAYLHYPSEPTSIHQQQQQRKPTTRPRAEFQYVQTNKVPSRPTSHHHPTTSSIEDKPTQQQPAVSDQSTPFLQQLTALPDSELQFSRWNNGPQPINFYERQQQCSPSSLQLPPSTKEKILQLQGQSLESSRIPTGQSADEQQAGRESKEEARERRRKVKAHRRSKTKEKAKEKEKERSKEKSREKEKREREKERERRHRAKARQKEREKRHLAKALRDTPQRRLPLTLSQEPGQPIFIRPIASPRSSVTEATLPLDILYGRPLDTFFRPDLPPFSFDLAPFSVEEAVILNAFEEDVKEFWTHMYVLVTNMEPMRIVPFVKNFWHAMHRISTFLDDTRFCLQFSTMERIMLTSLCDLLMSNPLKVDDRSWAAYMKDVSNYFMQCWQAPEDVGQLLETAPRFLGDRQAILESFSRTLYKRGAFVETLM